MLYLSTFSTFAQESKIRIAVMDLSSSYSGNYYFSNFRMPESTAAELTGRLTTELVNTKKYVVIERSRVQQVINELGFQSTQNANARAATIGNLLGVHKIML